MGLTRNQLTGQLVRGFESLLLRHPSLQSYEWHTGVIVTVLTVSELAFFGEFGMILGGEFLI